jgi:serine/threonine protein kinase
LTSIRRVLSETSEWDCLTNEVAEDINVLWTRFSLLRELNATNKARYFLAYDRTSASQQLVLLRVFAANATDEPSELLAFLIEALTAASLSHKNIAASSKPEQIEGIHFYTSQYPADARTLRDLLDQKGWFEVEPFLKIASQLAAALEYAQQVEVVHLKLQPAYVLVGKDHMVTLTGFGTPDTPTRQWVQQKRTQECAMMYRSPEQLANNNPDKRSDLYTLGVLLYEMLTDILPFQAKDESQLQKKIALQKAPSIDQIRPDIPKSISAIVEKLLAPNPAERFQDAAALRLALTYAIDIHSQAITLQADQSQIEKQVQEEDSRETLSQKLEGHKESPFDGLQDKSDVRFVAFPQTEALRNSTVRRSEKAVDKSGGLYVNQPERPLSLPTVASQHNQTDIYSPGSPTQILTGKVRAQADVLGRWNALLVILLAISVVMITALSVLAYRGYFEHLFKPLATAEIRLTTEPDIPTPPDATSSPQDNSDKRSENSASQSGATAEATKEPVAAASSQTPDNQPSDNSKVIVPAIPAPAAPSSVRQPMKPDTSRLREQLKQTNKAKAGKQKVRDSRSMKAKASKAKPRKGLARLRFW